MYDDSKITSVLSGARKITAQIAVISWLDYANAFRTYDWRKALPDPEVAIKQINQLLALV